MTAKGLRVWQSDAAGCCGGGGGGSTRLHSFDELVDLEHAETKGGACCCGARQTARLVLQPDNLVEVHHPEAAELVAVVRIAWNEAKARMVAFGPG